MFCMRYAPSPGCGAREVRYAPSPGRGAVAVSAITSAEVRFGVRVEVLWCGGDKRAEPDEILLFLREYVMRREKRNRERKKY